jgi:ATP citrate (pro-S)-lyase
MSAKAVREYHGKKLIARHIKEMSNGKHCIDDRAVLITKNTNMDVLLTKESWLTTTRLVVKPDQLIKRRGKAGLVGINLTWYDVRQWIANKMGQSIQIEQVTGILDHFIVEPFVPHTNQDEYYVCISSNRNGEEILFYHEGGVDVGDVDEKATKLQIDIDDTNISSERIRSIITGINDISRIELLSSFISTLFQCYRKLNFTYLEINPLVMTSSGTLIPLDLAAKIDETASFLNITDWGHLDFPPPFGRMEYPEEAYVRELDSKTGASLKLTILNPMGQIWTMVAGGGASVVYADTISDFGYGMELANYGEYSGAPSTEHTFEYAKTLIGLMTRSPITTNTTKMIENKIFLIGGGIANFTDVAATFTGLINAIKAYQEDLKTHRVKIWVS